MAMGDTSRDTQGVWGGGGEREILAVVTQSDLSRSHVSWRGGGGGRGGVCGYSEWLRSTDKLLDCSYA